MSNSVDALVDLFRTRGRKLLQQRRVIVEALTWRQFHSWGAKSWA